MVAFGASMTRITCHSCKAWASKKERSYFGTQWIPDRKTWFVYAANVQGIPRDCNPKKRKFLRQARWECPICMQWEYFKRTIDLEMYLEEVRSGTGRTPDPPA